MVGCDDAVWDCRKMGNKVGGQQYGWMVLALEDRVGGGWWNRLGSRFCNKLRSEKLAGR